MGSVKSYFLSVWGVLSGLAAAAAVYFSANFSSLDLWLLFFTLILAPVFLLAVWFLTPINTLQISRFLTGLTTALWILSISMQSALSVILVIGLAVVFWLIYDVWFSRYERVDNQLFQVGRKFPGLTLSEINGDIYQTDLAEKPQLLLFYRGNWCGVCMAQVKQIARQYEKISGKDVELLLISNQPLERVIELSRRFPHVTRFLVDPQGVEISQLGLIDPGAAPIAVRLFGSYGADTLLPSVIALDSQRRIIYTDFTSDYRVRPEPEAFLKAFSAV